MKIIKIKFKARTTYRLILSKKTKYNNIIYYNLGNINKQITHIKIKIIPLIWHIKTGVKFTNNARFYSINKIKPTTKLYVKIKY